MGVSKQSLNKYIFPARGRPGRTKIGLNTDRYNTSESLLVSEDLEISKRIYRPQNSMFIKRVNLER